jgi:ferric-dicitrate binding protein FerR (iron transport regulator)
MEACVKRDGGVMSNSAIDLEAMQWFVALQDGVPEVADAFVTWLERAENLEAYEALQQALRLSAELRG